MTIVLWIEQRVFKRMMPVGGGEGGGEEGVLAWTFPADYFTKGIVVAAAGTRRACARRAT